MIRRIRAFFGSMYGHIFLLLTFGMSAAAIVSLLIAEQTRTRDIRHFRLQRVVASTVDIAARLRQDPGGTEALLAKRQIMGAYPAPEAVAIVEQDATLERMLRDELGPSSSPEAGQVPFGFCFPGRRDAMNRRAAGIADAPPPDCWVVRFNDEHGIHRQLAINLPRIIIQPSAILNPVYLLLIVCSSAGLSIFVARLAAAPLRRMEQAAHDFSVLLDPDPIEEKGPDEVRAALSTFNLMQHRVREGFLARTQLLAAISHDLQTPLTRMRLRLEHVSDAGLRERLIKDLSATQSLVREGLDLARSSDSAEEWSMIDLDSLLMSMAEDASEFGNPVTFESGCGAIIRAKPNALARCLTNLIDNAVLHGGSASISCSKDGPKVIIAVRDRGPGIAEALLERIFEPFTRGDPGQPGGRRGTGIGLTIAKSQALTFGATLQLRNLPEGGLVATIELLH